MDIESILASAQDQSILSNGHQQPDEPLTLDFPAAFEEEASLPWHVYSADSGQEEAGQVLPDELLAGIRSQRASIPVESELRAFGPGHYYYGHDDKAHLAYLEQYFDKRMKAAGPSDKRKISAFRAFQGREGSTAAINTYDGQIVTWGTGFSGLGYLGRVIERAFTSEFVKDLFGASGIRYRGRNTYDVVDLETGRVVSGKKEALLVIRGSLPLVHLLIHAARSPETRDAVTEAQLQTFLGGSGNVTLGEAVATQALFNMICHLRHWASGYAMGCLEWAAPQLEGPPSPERDKRLAVLVGRYFYGKARGTSWIPDWKQFQLYWKHMKEDGLDCLDAPFIRASAPPTDDPFAEFPLNTKKA